MPFPDEPAVATVIEYSPRWPEEFEQVAGQLRSAMGDVALAIDHIGSTSVPGLPAKDCVDVQVRVLKIDADQQAGMLAGIGFRRRPEPWNQMEISDGQECRKLVFAPPVGARRCNVHLRLEGGANTRFALLFRDYLRGHEAARRAWGAFKQRLAVSIPDLADYGQIKAPATEVLMIAAERWAAETGWRPMPGATTSSRTPSA